MTDDAVFKATYAGYAWVKTRGVAQFIFEVPQHEVNLALTVMGGMPNSAAETWCAIARLEHQPVSERNLDREIATQSKTVDRKAPASTPAQGYSRVQRAGKLCNDYWFQMFLHKKFNTEMTVKGAAIETRRLCDVGSRAEILDGTPAAELFDKLERDFICWRDEPGLSDE